MAVLFMDGFDAGDFAMKYNSYFAPTTINVTRFGTGNSIRFTNNGGNVIKSIPTSSAVYVGMAVYASANSLFSSSSNTGPLTIYGDSALTPHLHIRPASGTTMGLYRGTTLLNTFAFPVQTWKYIELYANIDDVNGEYIVKVDGVTVLSATNVDTRNGGTSTSIDAIKIGAGHDSFFYIDDLYISDSEFMGDIRIQTLVPTAAGSSTQLTPTGGANYANVADIPDSTATYNASSTVGNKDLYALGDLAATTTTVKCVQVNTHSWKDDAGTASLKAKIKSGSTEADGTTTSLPSSVAWVGDRWETDPNTSAAWTVSAVNSLEAGAEVA